MGSKREVDLAEATLKKVRSKIIRENNSVAKKLGKVELVGALTSGQVTGWYYNKVISIAVVDVDTIEVVLDLGFCVRSQQTLRLARCDSPEKSELASALGVAMLTAIFSNHYVVSIQTIRREKYGRYLAEVVLDGIGNLSDFLLAKGIAKKYTGKQKLKWTPEEVGGAAKAIKQVLASYKVAS